MKMHFLLLTALVCLVLVPSLAEQNENLKLPSEVKKWQVPVKRGEVEVILSSYSRRGHPWDIISINPARDASISSVSEQVELIRKTMLEMPSLGYRPLDLGEIAINLLGTDFQGGLNQEVARSEKWRGCIGYMHCSAIAPVMVQYLQSHSTYGPLDGFLRANGLRIGPIYIEEPVVALARASSADSRSKVTTTPTSVLCGGMIHIYVEWKDD